MTEPRELLPHHVAKKTPQWDDLLAGVADILEDDGTFTQEGARKALDIALELDPEDLERNRYYGIGKVACEIARNLYVPERRAVFVDKEAAIIANAHDSYCATSQDITGIWQSHTGNRRLRLSEVEFPIGNNKYDAGVALANLPTVTGRLINTLVIASGMLRTTAQGQSVDRDNEYLIRMLVSEQPAAEQIGNGLLFTSYRIVHFGILHAIGRRTGVIPEAIRFKDPYIFDYLDEQELRDMPVTTAALMAAGLRIDEVRDGLENELEYVPDDDSLRMRQETLRRPPLPVAHNKHGYLESLHTARLRCPALHVTGMIPYVVDMVPDILIAADQKIVSNKL
jgi:hypothetical protein